MLNFAHCNQNALSDNNKQGLRIAISVFRLSVKIKVMSQKSLVNYLRDGAIQEEDSKF